MSRTSSPPPAVKPLDLVALLYGQPPGVSGAKSLKGSIDRNRFRMDVYARGAWAQSLWIDPVTGRLAEVEIADRNGSTAYRALFHDAEEVGSLSVPRKNRDRNGGDGEGPPLHPQHGHGARLARRRPGFLPPQAPRGRHPPVLQIKRALNLTAGTLSLSRLLVCLVSVSSGGSLFVTPAFYSTLYPGPYTLYPAFTSLTRKASPSPPAPGWSAGIS